MEHILQHGQAVHQIVVLENHAHLPAQGTQRAPVLLGDRLPFEQHLAAADRDQPVDGAQQGGLPDPEGPITEMNSPSSTSKLTPFRRAPR